MEEEGKELDYIIRKGYKRERYLLRRKGRGWIILINLNEILWYFCTVYSQHQLGKLEENKGKWGDLK